MPWRCWKPACDCPESQHFSTRETTCPSCGTPYTHGGWRPSVVGFMLIYMHKYGLAPIGPHRAFAAEIMKGAFRTCRECAGGGFVDSDGDRPFCECPACHGRGGILAIPVKEFVARRERILAKYPGKVLSCELYDPVTGEVHHLEGHKPGTVIPPLDPADDVEEQGTGAFLTPAGPSLTARDLFQATQMMLPRAKRRTWEEAGGKDEGAESGEAEEQGPA